jgi:ABC-type lipoprotein release transport system permease subunit
MTRRSRLIRGLREAPAPAAIGAALGLAGAAGFARTIAGLLYGVEPTDAATLAGVTFLVALVALIAATVPAWRASRLDPTTALRAD